MGYLSFIKENTSDEEARALKKLEEKRLKAIEYLGERWILAKKVKKIETEDELSQLIE